MRHLKLGNKIIKVGDKVRLTDKRRHGLSDDLKLSCAKDGTVMRIDTDEVLVEYFDSTRRRTRQWWNVTSLGLEEFESIENEG